MRSLAWILLLAAGTACAAFPQAHGCRKLLDFSSLPEDGWKIALSASYDNPSDAQLLTVKKVEVRSLPWAAWPLDAVGARPAKAPVPSGIFALGIRIRYPEIPLDGWAALSPAKPAGDFGRASFPSPIMRIRIRAKGLRFPFGIVLLLRDTAGRTAEFPFAQDLGFDGWRELYWEPGPADQAAASSAWTFDSIRLTRRGEEGGGDFVVYLKDLYVEY